MTCEITSGDKLYTGEITIPEHVTIKGRTLTVTTISKDAFNNCAGLTSFDIPQFITMVEVGAFNGCTGLTKVRIEDSDTPLGLIDYSWDNLKELFHDCPLKAIYIGRDFDYTILASTGKEPLPPFRHQTKLTDVSIGHLVTRIHAGEFYDCPAFANIIIPNSVTEIYDGAFRGCSKLKTLTIEDGDEILTMKCSRYIKENTFFQDCPLETLYLGRDLSFETTESPFYKVQTIKNLTIGNSVTKIGNDLFSYCSGIKNLTLGNSITEIGKKSFAYCTGLTNLTISNSVTMIREYAFRSCTGLTNLILGNSLTYIDSSFRECTGISTIYSLNPIPPTCFSDFTNGQYLNTQLYVPAGSLPSYQSEIPWKYFWNISEFESTDIHNVTIDGKGKDIIYDLQGNKLLTPQKGLNIINGKKILKK